MTKHIYLIRKNLKNAIKEIYTYDDDIELDKVKLKFYIFRSEGVYLGGVNTNFKLKHLMLELDEVIELQRENEELRKELDVLKEKNRNVD